MNDLETAAYQVLRQSYDPEIPVNIVDLGLVREVRVDAGRINVVMTLTSRHCPLADFITAGIEERLRAIDGVRAATVRLVWEPPWTPRSMTPAGRAELGLDQRLNDY